MIHKIYIILRYSQLEEHFLGYVSEVNILGFGQVEWFLRGWFLNKRDFRCNFSPSQRGFEAKNYLDLGSLL